MQKGSAGGAAAAGVVPECDVIVTRTHEYFVSGAQCLAVRDLSTGKFLRNHPVIGVPQAMTGAVSRAQSLASPKPLEGMPAIGEWLCLRRGDTLHYMGPVLAHERRMPPVSRRASRAGAPGRG